MNLCKPSTCFEVTKRYSPILLRTLRWSSTSLAMVKRTLRTSASLLLVKTPSPKFYKPLTPFVVVKTHSPNVCKPPMRSASLLHALMWRKHPLQTNTYIAVVKTHPAKFCKLRKCLAVVKIHPKKLWNPLHALRWWKRTLQRSVILLYALRRSKRTLQSCAGLLHALQWW